LFVFVVDFETSQGNRLKDIDRVSSFKGFKRIVFSHVVNQSGIMRLFRIAQRIVDSGAQREKRLNSDRRSFYPIQQERLYRDSQDRLHHWRSFNTSYQLFYAKNKNKALEWSAFHYWAY
jgi:hypothetical protein